MCDLLPCTAVDRSPTQEQRGAGFWRTRWIRSAMIQMKAVGTRGSRLPRAEALVSLTGSLRRLLPHRFCCSLCLGLPQSMTLWPPAHNGLERRVDGACLRLELRGGTAASARRLRARHSIGVEAGGFMGAHAIATRVRWQTLARFACLEARGCLSGCATYASGGIRKRRIPTTVQHAWWFRTVAATRSG